MKARKCLDSRQHNVNLIMTQQLKPTASGVSRTVAMAVFSSEATALAAVDAPNRKRVRWALPTISRTDRARDLTAARRYIKILHNQTWTRFRTEEDPLKIIRIRAPVFERTGNNLTVSAPWGPHSPGLVRAYNFIKASTVGVRQPNHDVAIDRFRQDRFSAVWEEAGADAALALCNIGDRPMHALSEDLQVVM